MKYATTANKREFVSDLITGILCYDISCVVPSNRLNTFHCHREEPVKEMTGKVTLSFFFGPSNGRTIIFRTAPLVREIKEPGRQEKPRQLLND